MTMTEPTNIRPWLTTTMRVSSQFFCSSCPGNVQPQTGDPIEVLKPYPGDSRGSVKWKNPRSTDPTEHEHAGQLPLSDLVGVW
jgi:hypothetical protein